MRQRIGVRLLQTALRGAADFAENVDGNLKGVFDQSGLPTPAKTGGQMFANTMRRYAARLDRHSRGGTRK